MAAAARKRITLPRIDTGAHWLRVEEESVESRLITAVAATLGVDRDSIELFDSFIDLGGDQRTAAALRRACMNVGMSVSTKDILACHTLAELQTHITPCARRSICSPPSVDSCKISPLKIRPISHRLSSPVPAPAPALAVPGGSASQRSRRSTFSTLTGASNPKNPVEEFLYLCELVCWSALVKPRAGLFEDRLVAFLTLSSFPPKELDPDSDVQLIPQSQMFFAGTQVASIKQDLQATRILGDLPDVWVVLEAMPLTESGDADRRRLRTWIQNVNEEMYQQIMALDTRETLEGPSTEMERSLQRLVAKVLQLPQEQVGMNFSFTQLGGDELAAMELMTRAKLESIYLNANEILQSNSLGDLANAASQRGGLAHKWSDESLEGFGLAPMQQLYFQTAMGGAGARRASVDGGYRFNLSLLFKIKKSYSLDDIWAAVEAVVGHHSMLRARFSRTPSGWRQRVLKDVEGSYALGHHTISTDEELEAVIAHSQSKINIEKGPVFAVDHFHTNDGHQMLYLVAHHLVVDLLSWRVIIQDIDELLENGSLLSQRSMPFQKWNDLQREDVQKLDPSQLSSAATPGDYRYWGLEDAPNTYGDAAEVGFSLSAELTALFQTTCNQVFRTDSADIYLAALLLSFSQTFIDRPTPVVWNQEHGREPWNPDIDITETVGWFTTLCPVGQSVEPAGDLLDVLRRLKDSRRAGPGRNSQYFASRFFNPKAPNLFTHDWPFEVIFSYAGSLQQLERGNGVLEQLMVPGRTLESETSDIGPKVGRIALFEINAMVDHGIAKVKMLYNRRSRHQDLIAVWIQNYEHLLLEAIGRLRYHAQQLTLADLPHLDVTYKGLDKLNNDRVSALNLTSARDIEAVYPVTATQQSILISQAGEPEVGQLHSIYDFASPNGEPVNISRLCTAWQHVVAKHTALRTVFIDSVTETGLYDQVVLRRCSPDMLFIDAPPGEDPVETLKHLPLMSTAPAQPQHRLTVCKASTRTLIKLDVNEALCDPLSVHVLVSDLRRAYATEKALPEPTGLSYPDYIKFLQSARSKASLDFWKERLSGVQPCIFPRLAVAHEATQYEMIHFEVDVIEPEKIAEFSRANNTSTDAVLRLAWALVLRAFTGANEVCFGYRATGREAASGGPSLRGAVGCFANTVICNMNLSPYKSLAAVLRSAEEAHAACLPHQQIAVAEIHHAMGVRGNESLFNSCLSFTGEASDLNSKFTTRSNFELRNILTQETSQYDLAVHTRFANGKLVVDVGSSIMADSQAVNLANTFGQAVKAILNAPNGSIGGVDLFSDHDYAQLVSWGGDETSTPKPRVGLLHELVNKSGAQSPDAPAICAWDGELTYHQLEQYAAMLAYRLTTAGVGPHVTVPVVLEKSMWAPVIMLAVMKAGGSFVPIDSDELNLLQPIFEQLDAKIAVTCESAAGILGNVFQEVIVVSAATMGQLRLPEHRLPPPAIGLEDLACLFFTPISSRDVKGLAFTHNAMSTALTAQAGPACINSQSRVMQLSSFSVDIALAEVFTTLISGGCVCIPTSPDRVVDFTGAVQRMGVNWSYMTPILSRKLDVEMLPSLKTVCFRTRSLDEDSWLPWAGKKKVLFAYGAPDVCPLGISFLEVFGPQQLNRIGRPVVGSFWIVNPEDHRKLMPVGTVGELVIEGPTLGCDFYHGKIDQSHWNTAVFNAGPQTRYFKTGHRVRYAENGCVEIVSNKKEDLDIGGKTIVLTEVEQHLRRCLGQGVDVMVEAIAFRGDNAAPVLAAFIELGSLFEGSEDLTQLTQVTKERLFIAKKLIETTLRNWIPAHMVPEIFIPVKHLPVTPSLKVNRRKLQKRIHGFSREQLLALPMVANPDEVQTIGLKPLPLTETEEQMRGLWARVLKVDKAAIGAGDGFLRAGGDEILAASVVVACRAQGLTIPIADLLRNATLTEICRCMSDVEELYSAKQNSSVSPVWPSSTASPLPVINVKQPVKPQPVSEAIIQKVLAPKVGADRNQIEAVAEASATQIRYIESGMLRGRANIDYFVFNFSGAVNGAKLEEACHTLAVTHPILRTAFVPHHRKVYQVVLASLDISFKKYHCPSWRLTSQTNKTISKDRTSPIAFSIPMTKFMFLDGGKQSALILRLSKAQYDDVSIGLLVKDLKQLYDQGGSPIAPPPQRPTYCDFVHCAQLANSQGALEYWRGLLDGATVTSVVAHTKPYALTNTVRTIQKQMPIRSLADLGISFETVLKAAWAMVLATLAGTDDVIFGELVEGRHVRLYGGQSVSGVLGPTSNIIPVRIQFPDMPLSPLDLLHCVHAQRIAGIPYENLGFLDIVEKCTSWPYWTRFSTVVQHLYEDTAIIATEPKTFHLGPAACELSVEETRAQDVPDMFVRSMMRGTDRVELSLRFCENRVPASFAEETLRLLCDMMSLLTSVSIMQPIVPTGIHYASLQRRIPLPQQSPDANNSESGLTREQLEAALPAEDAQTIRNLISTAWATVIEPKDLGVPDEYRHTAAFYDLWGSLIPAAQLANCLNKELRRSGLPVLEDATTSPTVMITMEDVVEHPTMAKQFELIARKVVRVVDAVPNRGAVNAQAQAQVVPATPVSTVSPSSLAPPRLRKTATGLLGKGIQRLTTRSVTTPVVMMTSAVSPLTTPISREAPQIPEIRRGFTPLIEEREAEAEAAAMAPRRGQQHLTPPEDSRRRSADGHSTSASGAESMTEGSSAASSRHSASGDEAETATPILHVPQPRHASAGVVGLGLGASIRAAFGSLDDESPDAVTGMGMGMDVVVSPLSPPTATTRRFFGHGGGGGAAVSAAGEGKGKRRSSLLFGRLGMGVSPVN